MRSTLSVLPRSNSDNELISAMRCPSNMIAAALTLILADTAPTSLECIGAFEKRNALAVRAGALLSREVERGHLNRAERGALNVVRRTPRPRVGSMAKRTRPRHNRLPGPALQAREKPRRASRCRPRSASDARQDL